MIGYPSAPRYVKAIGALTGDEEISPPGLTIEADRPEYSYVKRERLWIASFNLAALAGNFNQFALSTIVGDILSVCTHVLAGTSITNVGLAVIAGAAAGPGAAGGINFRDSRQSGLPQTKQFNKQAAARLLNSTRGCWQVPANVWTDLPAFIFTAPATGGPGTLIFESDAVNVQSVVYAAGYERVVTPEEKADA